MRIITQANYKSTRGEKPRGKSLTQLAEYVPLQKMLANLTIAGLNAANRQALEYYDSNRGPDDVDIPLLPRHINPDITEVSMVASHFAEQKMIIEERVRLRHEEEVEKARAAQQAEANPPPGAPGSGGGVSAPAAQ